MERPAYKDAGRSNVKNESLYFRTEGLFAQLFPGELFVFADHAVVLRHNNLTVGGVLCTIEVDILIAAGTE